VNIRPVQNRLKTYGESTSDRGVRDDHAHQRCDDSARPTESAADQDGESDDIDPGRELAEAPKVSQFLRGKPFVFSYKRASDE